MGIQMGKKTIQPFLLLFLFILNIYFSTWFVRQAELNFHTDIGRDFLLLDELSQKKIILIGPRSGAGGLFHGPTWTYLNYPAYLMGKGNPLTVGKYWILLTLAFYFLCFKIAKKITGTLGALVYVLLMSGNLMFQTGALYNPHGALFLMPLFFYSMHYYRKTLKPQLLALHFLTAGLVIQFQMSVGVPLTFISLLLAASTAGKKQKLKHLWTLLAVPLTLVNFLVFDFRHQFSLSRALLEYISPQAGSRYFNYFTLIPERVDRIMDLNLSLGLTGPLNGFIFALLLFSAWSIIRKRGKNYQAFILIFIYYFGYMAFSFVNKGIILPHQILPLSALTVLWFSLLFSHKKKYMLLMLFFILLLNYSKYHSYLSETEKQFLGKAESSYQFLHNLGKEIAQKETEEFGYFVYSPDAFAYSPRYAFRYTFAEQGVKAYEYQKKSVTYVIASPPAPDRIDLSYDWWRKNQVKINKDPTQIITRENGFMVERFELTDEELKIAHDPLLELGIHFR